MPQKKLTGWLILLMVWIGFVGPGGSAHRLRSIKAAFEPILADYPSLPTAITIFQLSLGAGIAIWIYTVWVIYRRQPGTLAMAQGSFVAGSVLKLASVYVIPLFGGLPAPAVEILMAEALRLTVYILVFTAVWYLYLSKSQRVREIFLRTDLSE